jgi:hypothetical protein
MKPAARVAIWLAAGSVLALVALSYLSPHLMVDLAARLWACF